jgi:hypothetical protein
MIFIALFAVALAACNGDSPTEPPSIVLTSARLDFSMSTTSSHTIRVARMTFDGREVAKADVPGGGGQVRLQANVEGASGQHTIRLVIVEQLSTPNPYFGSGAVTTLTRVMDLAPVQGTLATGEALEFKFSL